MPPKPTQQTTGPDAKTQAAAVRWACEGCGWTTAKVEPLAGDASSRHYLRLQPETEAGGAPSWILMISPPQAGENNEAFCRGAELLHSLGLRVPEIRLLQPQYGWLLLTDFGDELYLDALRAHPPQSAQAMHLYRSAIDSLLLLQLCPPKLLHGYGRLHPELAARQALLVKEWYLDAFLGLHPGKDQWRICEAAIGALAQALARQPQVLVHFDFQSRNLLVQPDGVPAVVDFQDALVGPAALDPVSLLRDCYWQLSAGQIGDLLDYYRQSGIAAGVLPQHCDADTLRLWFDQCGLQRHLRVLGTFCRLYLRDGKASYLPDLPLTLQYCFDACAGLPDMQPLGELLAASETALTDKLAQMDASATTGARTPGH